MRLTYERITSIHDPNFAKLHALMRQVFPPEEVLAYELWDAPLQDPSIHVYVAVGDNEVVGATEYRYYPDMLVAMTDFTIIGRAGMSIGRFLLVNRTRDIQRLAEATGTSPLGMFAEIYDPQEVDYAFGGVTPMHPAIRREVLSHIGYRKLDLSYVHPSWDHEGKAVTGLNLCFQPADDELTSLPTELIHRFLSTYYAALPNKPDDWQQMMDELAKRDEVELLPL